MSEVIHGPIRNIVYYYYYCCCYFCCYERFVAQIGAPKDYLPFVLT
jgi:hypothetical protein